MVPSLSLLPALTQDLLEQQRKSLALEEKVSVAVEGFQELKDIKTVLEKLGSAMFRNSITIKETSEKIIEKGGENFKELISSMTSSSEENTQSIIENNTENDENLIEAQEDLSADAERERKRDATSSSSVSSDSDKSSFGSFKKAYEEGREGDLGDMFGLKSLQQNLGKKIGNFVQVMSLIGSNLFKFTGIGTAIVAAFNGVFEAFEWFENQEGTIGQKIMAGIEGFFQGIAEVIAFPLDWIREKLASGLESLFGENAISDLLNSFTVLETLQDLISGIFLVFEDVVEILTSVANTIGESETFQLLKKSVTAAFNGLIGAFEWIADKISFFLGKLGFDQNETAAEQMVELSEDQQGDQIKSARQSGLYNKNIFGESVVDESKLDAATPAQLQAILNDEDLSPEQQQIVTSKLRQKIASGQASGADQNQVFAYTQGDTAVERARTSALARQVAGEPTRTSPGTLQTAIQVPATPMVVIDAPQYQTPSAQAMNNFEMYTQNMMTEQRNLDQNMANESNASLGIVNAPSSVSNVNNSTIVQGGSVVTHNPLDRTQANYRHR